MLACEVSKSQEARVVLFPAEKALWAEFGPPGGWSSDLTVARTIRAVTLRRFATPWRSSTGWPLRRLPAGNAVAERFIQMLKVELIWTRDWETIAELREAINVWMEQYNHPSAHQALDWETPAERRAKKLRCKLELAA